MPEPLAGTTRRRGKPRIPVNDVADDLAPLKLNGQINLAAEPKPTGVHVATEGLTIDVELTPEAVPVLKAVFDKLLDMANANRPLCVLSDELPSELAELDEHLSP